MKMCADADINNGWNIDSILTEEGEFGKFQVITYYLLICIPNIISATYGVNYMISANTLDYRWGTHSNFSVTQSCMVFIWIYFKLKFSTYKKCTKSKMACKM